jgi:oxalyl-CoA decarboxylase
MLEAFGWTGYDVTDAQSLTKALTEAFASGKPPLINWVIDPHTGRESGHNENLSTMQAGL